MWNCQIDDPRITKMDPVRKIWMFENWVADQSDRVELAKNHGYLIASFINPEAVKQIIGDGNTKDSTEEEFDETSKMIRDFNVKSLKAQAIQNVSRKKKRRRIINKDNING